VAHFSIVVQSDSDVEIISQNYPRKETHPRSIVEEEPTSKRESSSTRKRTR
jgi:hypothetical protein